MSLLIRPMRESDYADVKEISMLTWGGEDYLHNVFHKWLKDGYFYAVEVDGKVIGTAKLSILPDKVGWLEGLRIHPEYRGRGLGRKMHEYILDVGIKLLNEGKIDYIEFATHLYNKESRKMAEEDGFNVVKKFYFAYREPAEPLIFETAELTIGEMPELKYIPCGWKFLHNTRESIKWLNNNSCVGHVRGHRFIYPREGTEPAFFPLDMNEIGIYLSLRAISHYARESGRNSVGTMIPENREDTLKILKNYEFQSMVNFSSPDVLVYRYVH